MYLKIFIPILWPFYFFTAYHVIEANNGHEKSMLQQDFQEIVEEFSNSSISNNGGSKNSDLLNLDVFCDAIMAIGYQRLVKKSEQKKDKILLRISGQLNRSYERFGHALADYADSLAKLGSKMMDIKNKRALLTAHDKMFALLLYANYCDMVRADIEITQKKGKHAAHKDKHIEIVKNLLKKLRKTLLIKFEKQKREFVAKLGRDAKELRNLIEKNEQNLRREKSARGHAFNDMAKLVRQESLRQDMDEAFSNILQRIEQNHRHSVQIIDQTIRQNRKVKNELNQIVHGDYFYLTVKEQIQISLMDGMRAEMAPDEDWFEDIYSLIMDAQMLLDDFIEQEQITQENGDILVHFVSYIPYAKLVKLFDILTTDEERFLYWKSFRGTLKLIKKSFNFDFLWQYLAKLDEINVTDIDNNSQKFAKTKQLANQFVTLNLYSELYKTLFIQFFAGQNGKTLHEHVPMAFRDNLSPEEYLAYWLVEMSRYLKNALKHTKVELGKQLRRDMTALGQIYADNLDSKLTPIRDEYSERIGVLERMKRRQNRKLRRYSSTQSRGGRTLTNRFLSKSLSCIDFGRGKNREKIAENVEKIEQNISELYRERREKLQEIREKYEEAESEKFEILKMENGEVAEKLGLNTSKVSLRRQLSPNMGQPSPEKGVQIGKRLPRIEVDNSRFPTIERNNSRIGLI